MKALEITNGPTMHITIHMPSLIYKSTHDRVCMCVRVRARVFSYTELSWIKQSRVHSPWMIRRSFTPHPRFFIYLIFFISGVLSGTFLASDGLLQSRKKQLRKSSLRSRTARVVLDASPLFRLSIGPGIG